MANKIKCPKCGESFTIDKWNKKTAEEFNQLPGDYIEEIDESLFKEDGSYNGSSISPLYICPGCGKDTYADKMVMEWDTNENVKS